MRSSTIRARLALSFVLVAMISVALLAVLSLIFAERDLSTLAAQRREDLTRSLVTDAASAWTQGGWTPAELEPITALAASTGAEMAILDTGGRLVVATPAGAPRTADTMRVPIRVRSAAVGTLVISFKGADIDASADRLRRSLTFAVGAAAVVAMLLAWSVALLAARRLTRPLVALIDAVRAVTAGDRTARVGPVDAPGEIRTLAAGVDLMTDTLIGQEQLQRDLVADVAHELRTPVAVLQAGCEAILDGVNEPSHAEIASLHEEILRLARLVTDLQVLAAADAAALHLITVRTDLAGIAADAADSLAPRFAVTGLRLHRDLASTVVVGDPDRLRQITLNLLTNAVKFTPPGGRVSLTVRADAAHAELIVADTGVGIAAGDLPRVFDRFWRGRHTNGPAGSGIGLAIVAELTRKHGGTVEVRSEPGAGTVFTVSLPLAAPVRGPGIAG